MIYRSAKLPAIFALPPAARLCLFLAGLTVFLCLCQSVAMAQSPRGNTLLDEAGPAVNKALVVGVSDYRHIDKLAWASRDALLFANFLSAHPELGPENVTLLTDEQVTREAVLRQIYPMLKTASPGERVIFYFAGHGDANRSGMVQTGYLLCHGVESGIDYELSQAIKIKDLLEYAAAASDRGVEVILIIDACRSGMFVQKNAATVKASLASLVSSYDNTIRLVSCQPGQMSYEDRKWNNGQGVFTMYLLKALQGEAFEGDGPLTLNQLQRYLNRNVSEATSNRQIPSIAGDLSRTLFRQRAPAAGSTTTPQGTQPQSGHTRQHPDFRKMKKAVDDGRLIMDEGGQSSALSIFRVIKASGNLQLIQEAASLLGGALEQQLQAMLHSLLKNGQDNTSEAEIQEARQIATILQQPDFMAPEPLKEDLAVKDKVMEGYLVLKQGRRERYDFLLNDYKKLMKTRPEDAFLFHLAGQIYYRQRNYLEAAYYLKRTRELAGRWAIPQESMINVYAESGDFEAALNASKDFEKLFPNREKVLELLQVSGFTTTGIKVSAGETLQIKANGNIRVGQFVGNASPAGREGGVLGLSLEAYSLVGRYAHAALMYRVQGEREWQYAGEEVVFTAARNGLLELHVNDKNLRDNEGSYTVVVTRK